MPLSANDQLLVEIWAAQNNLVLDDSIRWKIEIYHDLITSWAKRMNLVSGGDLEMLIERHFLDSLSPLGEISPSGDLLDIGSGAGFPAIPLALFRANVQFTLVESVHKKILFLRQALENLKLANIIIMESRIEQLDPRPEYDIITIRALPKWEKLMRKIKAFLRPDGKIIYFEKFGKYRLICNG